MCSSKIGQTRGRDAGAQERCTPPPNAVWLARFFSHLTHLPLLACCTPPPVFPSVPLCPPPRTSRAGDCTRQQRSDIRDESLDQHLGLLMGQQRAGQIGNQHPRLSSADEGRQHLEQKATKRQKYGIRIGAPSPYTRETKTKTEHTAARKQMIDDACVGHDRVRSPCRGVEGKGSALAQGSWLRRQGAGGNVVSGGSHE